MYGISVPDSKSSGYLGVEKFYTQEGYPAWRVQMLWWSYSDHQGAPISISLYV